MIKGRSCAGSYPTRSTTHRRSVCALAGSTGCAASSRNMVFSLESYIDTVGGSEGVKLEDQLLITDDGPELLSRFPFEEALLG
jgi:hypothetical protein